MLSRVSCSLLHLHPSDNSRLDNLISWFAASILVTAPNSGGIRLNEHVEADGPTARLQNGPGGPCVEAARLVLSQRPIPRLAQNEKPECAGSEAGGGGGLGAMSETDHLSQAERLIAECKEPHRPPTRSYCKCISERSRHRGACIDAASIGGRPSSLRDAPPIRP